MAPKRVPRAKPLSSGAAPALPEGLAGVQGLASGSTRGAEPPADREALFAYSGNIARTFAPFTLTVALATAFAGPSALAADPANPDWPCVQRKVVVLTSAQMWDGPQVDELTHWRDNEEIKKLIP